MAEKSGRKSSILKTPKPKPRTPLQDVNTLPRDEEHVSCSTPSQSVLPRRVSFAGSNLVKEFFSECVSLGFAPDAYETPLMISSDSSGRPSDCSSRTSVTFHQSQQSLQTSVMESHPPSASPALFTDDPCDAIMRKYGCLSGANLSLVATMEPARKCRFSFGEPEPVTPAATCEDERQSSEEVTHVSDCDASDDVFDDVHHNNLQKSAKAENLNFHQLQLNPLAKEAKELPKKEIVHSSISICSGTSTGFIHKVSFQSNGVSSQDCIIEPQVPIRSAHPSQIKEVTVDSHTKNEPSNQLKSCQDVGQLNHQSSQNCCITTDKVHSSVRSVRSEEFSSSTSFLVKTVVNRSHDMVMESTRSVTCAHRDTEVLPSVTESGHETASNSVEIVQKSYGIAINNSVDQKAESDTQRGSKPLVPNSTSARVSTDSSKNAVNQTNYNDVEMEFTRPVPNDIRTQDDDLGLRPSVDSVTDAIDSVSQASHSRRTSLNDTDSGVNEMDLTKPISGLNVSLNTVPPEETKCISKVTQMPKKDSSKTENTMKSLQDSCTVSEELPLKLSSNISLSVVGMPSQLKNNCDSCKPQDNNQTCLLEESMEFTQCCQKPITGYTVTLQTSSNNRASNETTQTIRGENQVPLLMPFEAQEGSAALSSKLTVSNCASSADATQKSTIDHVTSSLLGTDSPCSDIIQRSTSVHIMHQPVSNTIQGTTTVHEGTDSILTSATSVGANSKLSSIHFSQAPYHSVETLRNSYPATENVLREKINAEERVLSSHQPGSPNENLLGNVPLAQTEILRDVGKVSEFGGQFSVSPSEADHRKLSEKTHIMNESMDFTDVLPCNIEEEGAINIKLPSSLSKNKNSVVMLSEESGVGSVVHSKPNLKYPLEATNISNLEKTQVVDESIEFPEVLPCHIQEGDVKTSENELDATKPSDTNFEKTQVVDESMEFTEVLPCHIQEGDVKTSEKELDATKPSDTNFEKTQVMDESMEFTEALPCHIQVGNLKTSKENLNATKPSDKILPSQSAVCFTNPGTHHNEGGNHNILINSAVQVTQTVNILCSSGADLHSESKTPLHLNSNENSVLHSLPVKSAVSGESSSISIQHTAQSSQIILQPDCDATQRYTSNVSVNMDVDISLSMINVNNCSGVKRDSNGRRTSVDSHSVSGDQINVNESNESHCNPSKRFCTSELLNVHGVEKCVDSGLLNGHASTTDANAEVVIPSSRSPSPERSFYDTIPALSLEPWDVKSQLNTSDAQPPSVRNTCHVAGKLNASLTTSSVSNKCNLLASNSEFSHNCGNNLILESDFSTESKGEVHARSPNKVAMIPCFVSPNSNMCHVHTLPNALCHSSDKCSDKVPESSEALTKIMDNIIIENVNLLSDLKAVPSNSGKILLSTDGDNLGLSDESFPSQDMSSSQEITGIDEDLVHHTVALGSKNIEQMSGFGESNDFMPNSVFSPKSSSQSEPACASSAQPEHHMDSSPKTRFVPHHSPDHSWGVSPGKINRSLDDFSQNLQSIEHIIDEYEAKYECLWNSCREEDGVWLFSFQNMHLDLKVHLGSCLGPSGHISSRNGHFISHLKESHKPLLHWGRKILLSKLSTNDFMEELSYSSDFMDLLQRINSVVVENVDFLVELIVLEGLENLKISKDCFTFDVISFPCHLWFVVKVKLDSWEHYTPSHVSIKNQVGHASENVVRDLVNSVPKDMKFFRNFIKAVGDYKSTLERLAVG